MLGSLIKFEFKATYKTFLLLYAVILTFSVIYRFFIDFNSGVGYMSNYINISSNNIAFIIFTLIYVFLVITVGILTIFIIIKRFNDNLLGDAGYLMNTIPVQPWQNITSKVLVASVWTLCSMFVCFVSVVILITYNITLSEFFKLFGEFVMDIIEYNLFNIACNFFLCVIIQQAANIMIIYCSISIGHLFNKHRKLIAFAAFLFIQIIFSTIYLNIISTDTYNTARHVIINGVQHMNFIFSSGIFSNIVLFVIMFVITNYILKNRLNLE